MVTIGELRALYDKYMRQHDHDPSGEIITQDYLTRIIWHEHQQGMVNYSQLRPEIADNVIIQEIAYFKGLGYSFEWKHFSYDLPDDLGQRLIQHGFSQDEREAVMMLSIADAPDKLLAPITYDIQLATTEQHFKDMDAVFYEVWKDDPFTDATETRMSDWLLPRWRAYPENLSVFVVYADDRPISYGRLEYAAGNPIASMWGGSTIEAYRKRGIYTQLVAKRLQIAHTLGCQYLTVDARFDTSKPILERLGFIHIADATAYNWEPSIVATPQG